VLLTVLESEWTGHATAAGIRDFHVESHVLEQFEIALFAKDGAMMAGDVDDRLRRQARRRPARSTGQEFRERQRLPGERTRIFVVREEQRQLVAED
jgi:hypothetical protein